LNLHLCVIDSITWPYPYLQYVILHIYNSDTYNMSLFEAAIGWLAPPSCVGCGTEGEVICTICQELEIIPYGQKCFACGVVSPGSKTCSSCRRRGAPNHVWVSTEYEGLVAKLLQAYKFNHLRSAAQPISQMMASTIRSFNSDEMLERRNYLIVPVPTASSRVRQRGFDQTELMSRLISLSLRIDKKGLLSRRGQSQQVGSSRAQRYKQVLDTYYVNSTTGVNGRNVLLIDDVVTTGATLSEAARVLRLAGARQVDGLVFAKRL
jgi:ComF family protein